MIDFINDIEQQYEEFCKVAEEYGFFDANAAKNGFRCAVKKPEFNAGWIAFTSAISTMKDHISKKQSEIDELKSKLAKVESGEWVIVPKEPTPKMIDSTWNYDELIYDMSSNSRNEFIYKAMIEAAQENEYE